MFTTTRKKITMVAILGALTVIAGGATLLASPAAKVPTVPAPPCPNQACGINRECVTQHCSSCTGPAGGECNDSPPCSGPGAC